MIRLEQTKADHDAHLINARRYNTKTAKINAELVEIEAGLADAVQQATINLIFAQVDPGAAFLATPLDVQRLVLRSVLRVEAQKYTGIGESSGPRTAWVLLPSSLGVSEPSPKALFEGPQIVAERVLRAPDEQVPERRRVQTRTRQSTCRQHRLRVVAIARESRTR